MFDDLNNRPGKDDPTREIQKTIKIQRLAEAQGKLSASPAEWMEWASAYKLNVHVGFRIAVEDILEAVKIAMCEECDKGEPKTLPRAQSQGSTEQVLLDPIPFTQARMILHQHFKATGAELVMWIFQRDLRAWRAPTWEFLHFHADEKPSKASDAEQIMMTLNVQLSASEVDAFQPCERYLDYAMVLRRINDEAAASNVEAIRKEWERLHKEISLLKKCVGSQPMVAAVIPGDGYAARIEDGLFLEKQINIFLEPRSKQAVPPVLRLQESVRGINKQQVLDAFKSMVSINLAKALADGKGLYGEDNGAKVQKGTRGGRHAALWNPVILAVGLNEKYSVPMGKLKKAFTDHAFLREWSEEWHDALDKLGE